MESQDTLDFDQLLGEICNGQAHGAGQPPRLMSC